LTPVLTLRPLLPGQSPYLRSPPGRSLSPVGKPREPMYTHKYYQSLVQQQEQLNIAKVKLCKEQIEAQRWARPASHVCSRGVNTPRSHGRHINRQLDGMTPTRMPPVDSPRSEFGNWNRRRGGNRIEPGLQMKVSKTTEPINSKVFRAQVRKPFLELVDPAEDSLEAIALYSGFTRLKIEQLRQIFLAGASSTTRRINEQAFKKIYTDLGMEEELLTMLFTALVARGKDTLDFDTFIFSLKVLVNGTRQEQVLMIFKMIDTSCDRRLTKLELLKFFTSDVSRRGNKKITAALVDEMMILIDEDGSQEVTLEEFEKSLRKDAVWTVFNAISPLSHFAMKFTLVDLKTLKAAMFRESVEF